MGLDAFVREHPTTFIVGIGGALNSGQPHDFRSPDYDDWSLNGDLLFWDETLDKSSRDRNSRKTS